MGAEVYGILRFVFALVQSVWKADSRPRVSTSPEYRATSQEGPTDNAIYRGVTVCHQEELERLQAATHSVTRIQ